MKKSLYDLMATVEEIDRIIRQLEDAPNDITPETIKCIELATTHLENYKEMLWRITVEV